MTEMMLDDRLNRLLVAVRTIDEPRSLTAVFDALVARAAGAARVLTDVSAA